MEMHHNAEAAHRHDVSPKPLLTTIIIVLVFMTAEIVGGIVSNSLALIGDAGHMFVDALALGLSFFAMTFARRPATERKTFGYFRVEIMAALGNGVLLILIAVYILYEAYERFTNPPEVEAPLMLAVAVIGLVANIGGLFLLRGGHESLNIRSAFWHVATDTLSSVGVIIAAAVIYFTDWTPADPLIAALISLIILWGAVRLVAESVDILLEAVPKSIDIAEVVGKLKAVPGVRDVHDTHVWTITSGVYALSTHLSVTDQMVSRSAETVAEVNERLAKDFGITHTTLQLECDTCPSGFACGITELAKTDSEESEPGK